MVHIPLRFFFLSFQWLINDKVVNDNNESDQLHLFTLQAGTQPNNVRAFHPGHGVGGECPPCEHSLLTLY